MLVKPEGFYKKSVRYEGYLRAYDDIIEFIDRHSLSLRRVKGFNVDLVKSLLNCIYSQAPDLFETGHIEKDLYLITPREKKTKRYFEIRDKIEK